MKELIEIFAAAFRVGLFTFGGGYAMLPILQREVVETRGWVTEEEVLDYYAIGQCLPGVIMVNTMIFIGDKRKDRLGAIAAALGTVCPALIIITLIAALLTNFADVPAVKNAFAGIRVCVVVLILNAIIKLWKSSVVDLKCFVIFGIVVMGSMFTELTPVVFVILAAIAGIVIKTLEVKNK